MEKWSSKWDGVKREVLGHLDGSGQKSSLGGRCESREIRKDRSLVTLGKNGQAGRATGHRHQGRSVLEVLGQQRPVWLDGSGAQTASGYVSLSC